MAKRLFWCTEYTSGDTDISLDGISAVDCLGDSSNIPLEADCAAVVLTDTGSDFYQGFLSASPPVESYPDVIHPDTNFPSGDQFYWQRVSVGDTHWTVEKETHYISGTNIVDFFYTPSDIVIRPVQISYETVGDVGSDAVEYLTADEADYTQEDNTLTDFIDDTVTMEEGTAEVPGGFVGDWNTSRLETTHYGKVATSLYLWTFNLGTVYIYDITTTPYALLDSAPVTLSDNTSADISFCASGEYAYVGCPNHSGAKTEGGIVVVFQYTGGTLTEVGVIDPPAPARYGHFGDKIAVCPSTGATLAIMERGEPAVYIYDGFGLSWVIGATATSGDDYNYRVYPAIYEDVVSLIIGNVQLQVYENVSGTWTKVIDQGMAIDSLQYLNVYKGNVVYTYGFAVLTRLTIFHRTSPGVWDSGAEYDQGVDLHYGTKVAFTDTYILFGNYLYDHDGFTNSGRVYATDFDYTTGVIGTTPVPIEPYSIEDSGYCGGNGFIHSIGVNVDDFFVWAAESDVAGFRELSISNGPGTPEDPGAIGSAYVATTATTALDVSADASITSCTIVSTEPTECTIRFLISFDGRTTWNKWNGSAWVEHIGGLTDIENGNTATEVDTGLTSLDVSSFSTIDVAANFERTDLAALADVPILSSLSIDTIESGGDVLTDPDASYFQEITPVSPDSVRLQGLDVIDTNVTCHFLLGSL